MHTAVCENRLAYSAWSHHRLLGHVATLAQNFRVVVTPMADDLHDHCVLAVTLLDECYIQIRDSSGYLEVHELAKGHRSSRQSLRAAPPSS
jgi:hypothetical protein